jgi:hypothetical protein
MRIIILLLLTFPLFTCDSTPDAAAEERIEETTADAATVVEDTDGLDLLQQTAAAVERAGGDITAFEPRQATNNINAWITKLADVEGADPIIGNLALLKDELMRSPIDGPRVSELLGTLAQNTREVSDQAMGLSALADALQAGSDRLDGMRDGQ